MLNRTAVKKYLKIIIFCIIVFFIFLLNFFTPYVSDDDFLYHFIIDKSPQWAVTDIKIQSISDIVHSIYNHYFSWTGRITSTFITQLFIFCGKSFINLFNTICYVAIVYLILYHILGVISKFKSSFFILITIFLWFFFPGWGQVFLFVSGSPVYLWTTTIVLLFLIPFRIKQKNLRFKLNSLASIFFLFFSLLAGCSYENLGAGVIVFLCIYFILKFHKREKLAIFEVTGSFGFITGYCFMIFSPANLIRMAGEPNPTFFSISELFRKIVWASETYMKNWGWIYLVIFIFLLIEVKFVLKKKMDPIGIAFLISSLAANYVLILTQYFYPLRGFFPVTVFSIIGIGIIAQQVELPKIQNRYKYYILIFFSLIFFVSAFSATTKNVKSYLLVKSREHYIITQRDMGNKDIVVKTPVPITDNHMALHRINDLRIEFRNPNPAQAHFYGVTTITGKPPDNDSIRFKTIFIDFLKNQKLENLRIDDLYSTIYEAW